MRHMTALTMLAASLATAAPAPSQDDRAAAVLAQARKAVGGEEEIKRVKTLQATGEFRRVMGEMEREGELEILIEPPDKLRRNEEIGMPGGALMTRTEVLNGNQVWDDSGHRGGPGMRPGMAVVLRGPEGEMDPERVKDMQRRMRRAELARYTLAWLLTTDAAVTHSGIAEAPDGKADVLDVMPAEGPAMRLFIDQATHLPLMLTWQGPQQRVMMRRMGPGGNRNQAERTVEADDDGPPEQATFEMRFDDFRAVDGIRLPHLITRSVNGRTNEEWTIKTYKVNPSLKANTFTK